MTCIFSEYSIGDIQLLHFLVYWRILQILCSIDDWCDFNLTRAVSKSSLLTFCNSVSTAAGIQTSPKDTHTYAKATNLSSAEVGVAWAWADEEM
jgi:hypothetical protein